MGASGDAVQFIESKTMEVLGEQNKVAAIEAADKPDGHGVKQFRITFEKPVDPAISEVGTYGIENLEWTPEVYFADNVIRNNRARGSLFSTPKKTVVEKNVLITHPVRQSYCAATATGGSRRVPAMTYRSGITSLSML